METGGKKKYIFSSSICLIVICSLILTINARLVSPATSDPYFYYYSSGRKIPLTLSKKRLALRFRQGLTLGEQKAVVESEPDLGLFSQRQESPTFKLAFLPLCDGLTEGDVIQTLRRLNVRLKIKAAYPMFDLPHSQIVLTDEFIVRFDPNLPADEIDSFNALNDVEIARKLRWTELYVLRVRDITNMNTLKTANLYYESPLTVSSVPNFIGRSERVPTTPDDEYFVQQWCLQNTGQDPPSGDDDADIDAPEGWSISTGSPDIVIAVLDSGVDLGHDDLKNKFVLGYDAFVVPPNNDPSPGADPENAHGTACAGLAAAQTNNEIGISGVGWNCMLMPIRVFSREGGEWTYVMGRLIDGISWAANNGADVLSCSWPTLWHDQNLHDEIINAKTDGRDGKGCVLVFAADNWNVLLGYPAKYPEVIAVGATNHRDERWEVLDCVAPGSNFGPELDVVAPSGWGWGEDCGEVIMWTTDIRGNAGYNPNAHPEDPGDDDGDYYKWFGGTSAATPEVAGLAGLILSVNPDLTADEVQFIIESTADDQIGDPLEDTEGWDQYYGWGRINNESALLAAVEFPTDNTLVGWWKLDEGNGQIANDSAGDNNGEFGPDPRDPAWFFDDQDRGWCLDFDVKPEEEDYVSLSPIGALVTDTVTISAWIYADNLPVGSHSILIQSDPPSGYQLYVGEVLGNDKPIFYLKGNQAISVESIDVGAWYHLAGTYDGSDLKIYVDGGPPTTNPVGGLVGVHRNAYIGWLFDGQINDVRVYNYALDASEINLEMWDSMFPDTSRFRIKNSSGKTVAWFDSFGNLFLKGSVTTWVDPLEEDPDHDEFRVQNSESEDVAIIDTTDGNMYITGERHEGKDMSLLSPEGFIVKKSNGDVVAYIDDSGDEAGHLYLAGKLYQNPE